MNKQPVNIICSKSHTTETALKHSGSGAGDERSGGTDYFELSMGDGHGGGDVVIRGISGNYCTGHGEAYD